MACMLNLTAEEAFFVVFGTEIGKIQAALTVLESLLFFY